jgi:hypothetical protein
MTFLIAAVIIFLIFILGALLAWAFKGFDKAIIKTRENIKNQERAYNPALTMGYRINSKASAEEQIKEARRVSARRAAAMPRGANATIGWREDPSLTTASKGLDQDPWTATKIAQFHGWDGAKAGIPAGGVPEGGVAVAAVAPAAAGKIVLVPGKDYPLIEITDDMPADDKRKARIANSKAKSAAMKKAKAAGATAVPATAPVAAAAVVAAAAPVAVGIEAPKLVEITDDMPADEKRKARIANSKAKSAFNKQLKAAGIDPKTVEIDNQGNVVLPQAAAPVVAAPPPAAAPAAPTQAATEPPPVAPAAEGGSVDLAALGISPPDLVEITDDMLPDDKRQARIANSKAKSAFNKALKAAGVDPKSVKL